MMSILSVSLFKWDLGANYWVVPSEERWQTKNETYHIGLKQKWKSHNNLNFNSLIFEHLRIFLNSSIIKAVPSSSKSNESLTKDSAWSPAPGVAQNAAGPLLYMWKWHESLLHFQSDIVWSCIHML